MKLGIDKVGFYSPHYYVDMEDLAKARGDDPAKYTIGIGQDEMAVAPITQDAVTLAGNAALQILTDEDREQIDLVLFATETGVDHSKSAGVYLHELLGLKREARSIELKQACYAATAGIQLARGHIALNPESKVLVLASDIARYGLATPGEVTQGAGAVAILVSANPKILTIDNVNTTLTKDIMDFWRPIYSEYAYVDGHYSNEQYIEYFQTVWSGYQEKTGLDIEDFEALCFHLPYTKMGRKALEATYKDGLGENEERIMGNYEASTRYSRRVGNIYTASLYLGLISLLEHKDLPEGAKIGFFSYGSGGVGEFFSGQLEKGYRDHLFMDEHNELLNQRTKLSIPEYEEVFKNSLPVDGSNLELDTSLDSASILLSGVEDHVRKYVRK
ncbi:MAG TPA: hydroxymethylglutaryl-CoA synthase [Candidatus Avipropionibacterium sp.]|nr:hydroxymethylglutaryl-CoA synthase [Candidatus Avipropionibacterium sp.]